MTAPFNCAAKAAQGATVNQLGNRSKTQHPHQTATGTCNRHRIREQLANERLIGGIVVLWFGVV